MRERRRVLPTILLASLLLSAAGVVVRAQTQVAAQVATGVVDGVVTDTNLVSLSDATVSLLGSKIQVVTGANGRFRIRDLAAGHYILVVHRLGYAAVSTMLEVAERDTLRMSFALQQVITPLDTMVVEAKPYGARLSEFEERRKLGFGQFMTQAQIEKRNVQSLVDLLPTFTGVKIKGGTAISVRFGVGGTPNQAVCPYKFYLDGVSIPTPNLNSQMPSPKEIAGIEVYNGAATIPLQYKTTNGSFCGVILIWTRDGA